MQKLLLAPLAVLVVGASLREIRRRFKPTVAGAERDEYDAIEAQDEWRKSGRVRPVSMAPEFYKRAWKKMVGIGRVGEIQRRKG